MTTVDQLPVFLGAEASKFKRLITMNHFQGSLAIVVEMELAGIASKPPTLITAPSGLFSCKKLFSQTLLQAQIYTF